MTHDELLAKIDDFWDQIPADYGQFNYLNALRTVVELHKPQILPFDEYIEPICVPCDTDYPCPTIEAIEKELGGRSEPSSRTLP